MERKMFNPVHVVWHGQCKGTLHSKDGRTVFVIARGEGTKIISNFHGIDLSLKQDLPNSLDYLKFTGDGLTADNIILEEEENHLRITFHDTANLGGIIPDTEVILQGMQIDDLMYTAPNLEEWSTLIIYDGEEEDQEGVIVTARDKKGQKVVKSINERFNANQFQVKWLEKNISLAKKIRINPLRDYGHVIYEVFKGAEAQG